MRSSRFVRAVSVLALEPAPNTPTEPAGDGWLDSADRVGLGARLGRYELRAVVGVGGMAVVFAAHDPALDRAVAIKVPRATSRGTAGAARLYREAQLMARIDHPNVVRIHDVGDAHGRPFIAMELVRGGTLTDWLERERRAPAEILAVFARAGLGLAATHAAGLVHRDFKPANVLVGDDDRVLVTDFGIATTADAGGAAQVRDPAPGPRGLTRTCTGEVAGTPAYMAPEQLHGGPVDGRADQFSFCTALWRALFGTPPFPGDTLRELAASIAAGVVRPPPVATAACVSPALRAALERGLSIVPAARFAAMRELLAALAAG